MTREVVRWRRYGKDRLYVTGADGTKLGYRDLVTGEDHVIDTGGAAEFAAVIDGWLAATPADRDTPADPRGDAAVGDASIPVQREPVPNPPVAPPADVPAAPAECEDLAQRRAGAMAREQALVRKQAAPVRTLVARVLGVHTEERAWRIGADGEEKVAVQLAKLARKDPRWRHLHAIPVGENGADIDHLVVGPGGVYTLNAKHHPRSIVWVGGNTLMINGQRQPYIRNSRFEARRATRLLTAACPFPVSATGMVVPVGADNITVKTPPDDVHIVNRMRLVRWLKARPVVLADEQIEVIFEAARRVTTWQASG